MKKVKLRNLLLSSVLISIQALATSHTGIVETQAAVAMEVVALPEIAALQALQALDKRLNLCSQICRELLERECNTKIVLEGLQSLGFVFNSEQVQALARNASALFHPLFTRYDADRNIESLLRVLNKFKLTGAGIDAFVSVVKKYPELYDGSYSGYMLEFILNMMIYFENHNELFITAQNILNDPTLHEHNSLFCEFEQHMTRVVERKQLPKDQKFLEVAPAAVYIYNCAFRAIQNTGHGYEQNASYSNVAVDLCRLMTGDNRCFYPYRLNVYIDHVYPRWNMRVHDHTCFGNVRPEVRWEGSNSKASGLTTMQAPSHNPYGRKDPSARTLASLLAEKEGLVAQLVIIDGSIDDARVLKPEVMDGLLITKRKLNEKVANLEAQISDISCSCC